jgi:Acetyltransferase (GNAT) domain
VILLERRLFGAFRYRKAYFPDPDAIGRLTATLAPNEILRFYHPGDSLPHTKYLIERAPFSTVIVDLRGSLKALLAAMDKRGCRRPLLRAGRMLERVRITQSGEAPIADFLGLYNRFARAKGRVQPLSERNLRRYLVPSDLRVLYLDGRPLCGHVMLCDRESRRVVGVFTASRRLESAEDAALSGMLNRHLHWHEMQLYRARGIEWYDFGGIGHETPRAAKFNQFRLSFGGTIVSGYRYTFAGAGSLARLCLRVYEALCLSAAARIVPHV